MAVVESCEWVEDYIEFSPVDELPYIGYRDLLSDVSAEHGYEPIDFVGSHLFVDGVRFKFCEVKEGERIIKHQSMNKPYMYKCVLTQLLRRFSLQEIADKSGVGRSTIRKHAKEQAVVGARRTSWDVEDSWEKAKKKTRERDGECVACGIDDDAHKEKWGRPLTAHHVVPREMFDEKRNADSLDNLVALCCECHQSNEVTPRQLFLTAINSQTEL